MDCQEIVMQLIVHGGNARSKAIEAIQLARMGKITEARLRHEEATADLLNAHEVQTQLLQDEAAGNNKEITLLMVHAQDHLMNAITIKDLALEFINMYEKLQNDNLGERQ
jgi:PTS system cellobiose-specific IIA component